MSIDDAVLNIWILSPYHSGSHRAWAHGYLRHTKHTVRLLTMAGRFWKWRMQGGAVELAHQARRMLAETGAPDLIVATDMLNIPAWLGLMHSALPAGIPLVLYMHENQLTYPWRPGEKPDLTYAMINWTSQVAADHVAFNSNYHRTAWFEELPRLLKHYPDYQHLHLVAEVETRSSVLPVGIETSMHRSQSDAGARPLILWNQRWEYDKRPDRFFALLYRLQKAGLLFDVAVAGENFRNVPQEFEEAKSRLEKQIVHWGFAEDPDQYAALLARADLVVSTAIHEFFGISILEAISAGAFPLLPNALSYPELIPADLHPACLYADEDTLYAMALRRLTMRRPSPPSLQSHVHTQFGWPAVAQAYDRLFLDLVWTRTAR